jgi:hypothetical protein
VVTAANVADTTTFQAVLDEVPPVRTRSGQRRTRPARVHANKGYDSHANRAYLRRRGMIRPRIARRGIESSQPAGPLGRRDRQSRWRWVTQQARNLLLVLAEQHRRVRFVLRDREAKFTRSFDDVFCSQAPRYCGRRCRRPTQMPMRSGGLAGQGRMPGLAYQNRGGDIH